MPSTNPIDPQRQSAAYQHALEVLYDRINYERIKGVNRRYKFRLRRMRRLIEDLGLSDYLYESSAPAPPVPLIHIAGTKGKGSTAAMVAAVLTASGLRTGLYTSPHLHHLEERFRIDGKPCESSELIDLVARIESVTQAVEQAHGAMSFFELTTALALLHFDQSACDAVVVEVGLGGRLDSTNVCAPSVSVVTSIGLDHQHVLGDTLVQIAAEKAGIIKPDIPVVSGVADEAAGQVVARVAIDNGCDLFQLGKAFDFQSSPNADWGWKVNYRGYQQPLSSSINFQLAMEGIHQGRNAAIAIAVVDLLRNRGIRVPNSAIDEAMSTLSCIGRIERFSISEHVTAIVDAAHNQDSVDALCQTLRARFATRKKVIVFGTSVDKDAAAMLASLAEIADQIILTQFHRNPRYVPASELAQQLPQGVNGPPLIAADPIEACQLAKDWVCADGVIVVCGSFFLAAETRHWFAAQAIRH